MHIFLAPPPRFCSSEEDVFQPPSQVPFIFSEFTNNIDAHNTQKHRLHPDGRLLICRIIMGNFRIFKELYKNFLTDQKKRFITYGVVSFVCVFLECFGLSMIIPVLQLILNPEKLYAFLPPWLADIPQTGIIAGLIGICIVSIVLKDLLSILCNYLSYKTIVIFVHNTVEKLSRLEYNATYIFLQKHKHCELQTAYSACVGTNATAYIAALSLYGINGSLFFTILIMLFFFSPIITSSFFLFAVISCVIKKTLKKRHLKTQDLCELYQNKEQALNTKVNTLKEMLSFFCKIPSLDTLLTAFDKWKRTEQQLACRVQNQPFLLEFLGLICIAATILLLHFVYPFSVLMQQITFLVVCIVRILPYFNRFCVAKQQIDAYKSSVVYLNDFYRQLLEHQLPPYDGERVTFKHRLRLEQVCFCYDTETKKEVLHDVSLTVNEGDFFGLTGKSGAGKTTLVDTILGLLPPTKGTYSVDVNIITTHNQLAPFFGYVSQNPCIITGTVAENVIFGREPNAEQVDRVLKMAQLDEFQPDMYLAENGKNISGGQKQRIAIARALYGNPKLLILDEATASLDALTEEKISNVIASLKGKCTVIAIAHRLGTLKMCNRLVYMKEGRIAAEGTFNGLYQANEEFKELVDALERQSHLVHGNEAVAATAVV